MNEHDAQVLKFLIGAIVLAFLVLVVGITVCSWPQGGMSGLECVKDTVRDTYTCVPKG